MPLLRVVYAESRIEMILCLKEIFYFGNLETLLFRALGSNNFSGTLPSELGNLIKVEQMWAFDCSLIGKIPDFIGNWTNLTTLQITDINNVSSSLDFIKNIKNLIILSLRVSLINGIIPSDIGEYQSLQTLFEENFTMCGKALAHDRVNVLIERKITIVTRSFIFAIANSSFAIKCGGGVALIVDKIVYKADDYDLGGASFVVLDTEKWAVSDACWFPDGQSNTHAQNTGSQVTGTTIPELYHISRKSPGSLRYYELSLENGNYNVSLSFAETIFGDQGSLTWKSRRRCVFDIYIQYAVLLGIGPKPKTFSYAELRSATKDFSPPNKLGERRFGPVYKEKGICILIGLHDLRVTEFNEIEALRLIAAAFLCTQASPVLRPPMSRVLSMLAGDIEVRTITSKPSYLTDWDFKDMKNCFLNKDIDTSSSTRSYRKKNSQSENATDLSS
ncbi:hypothetical protein Pint_11520 [Pistacia integerrima]|uniref:Uncharacterized protein n=1 Tax=Pistacia integerrima TaxID=434235 RepID=A0ACC0XJ94_9ROSI|nr:hypothetical protein Pint_11520 [Pistacia integerrima]